MKKLTVFLLSSFLTMLFFCFSVEAGERSLPTVNELEKWEYAPYPTILEIEPGTSDPNGPGFTKNTSINSFLFTAPANHPLKQILVGIAKGDDGIIYAFAMGCWWKGEKKPVSCQYDHLNPWSMVMK